MNLFDETENKYFEFVSHLLQNTKNYSKNDIKYLIEKYLSGEPDFDVIDTIFADKEGEELVFYLEDGKYKPILENGFPIRMGTVEQQAAKTLIENEYIRSFLSDDTIGKLQKCTESVNVDWSTSHIYIKNKFSGGVIEEKREYGPIISLVAKAIKEHRAIVYDNVRENMFEYRNMSVFPVRIEFSIKNDKFRISAYEPRQHRFIKMNIDTMEKIKISGEYADIDLETEYKDFLKTNTRTVKLDVEPVGHVIERCFRIFSYYDRKARYDKEEGKYRLEISYLKSDEAEIIKDILSLGGYATVIEPRQLQKEVYRRVLAASKLYES